MLEKQIKPRKNSKLFTFGICSLVGTILSWFMDLDIFMEKTIDKTVISKKHVGNKKDGSKNLANPQDKKSEISQPDEVNKVNLSNQGLKNSTSPFGSYFSVKARGLEMLWVEPGNFVMGEMGHVSTRGVGSQQKVSITNGFWGNMKLLSLNMKLLCEIMNLD